MWVYLVRPFCDSHGVAPIQVKVTFTLKLWSMDKKTMYERFYAFKPKLYVNQHNVRLKAIVRAGMNCISTGGKQAPTNQLGSIISHIGDEVGVMWDGGDAGVYKLHDVVLYLGDFDESKITAESGGSAREDILSIDWEDLIGRKVKLRRNIRELERGYGVSMGIEYTVKDATGSSLIVYGDTEWLPRGDWEFAEYFTSSSGGISTKPMNDEIAANFEQSIKTKNDERDSIKHRYKVPRPTPKIGRNKENRRGAVSGARSKTRLG